MEASLAQMKKELRIRTLQKRSELSTLEIEEKSRQIFAQLMQLDPFRIGMMIMAYVDFRNEVATRNFIKQCLEMGKRVAVPRVVTDEHGQKGLWACEISDLDQDLEVGTFGVMEPKRDTLKRIRETMLDLVVVPGVVFDEDRSRIGYGAGFYDRFLGKCSEECWKIGVAFELQVTEKVPSEAHDVPLDIIITENRIIGDKHKL